MRRRGRRRDGPRPLGAACSPRSRATRSSLDGQLDWVTKLALLDAYAARDGLEWDDPKLALLDLQYHDVRPERSLYERLVRAGKVERLVDEADVIDAMTEPPASTRAYFRGPCLARWPDAVVAANWDSLILDVGADPLRRIPMMEPLRGTKAHVEALFEQARHAGRPGSPSWRRDKSAVSPTDPSGTLCEAGGVEDDARAAAQEATGSQGAGRRRGDVAAPTEHGEKLKDELDDLLDEIDEVLEENAEEFVQSYVQKGGRVTYVQGPLRGRNCHTLVRRSQQ